MTGEDDVRTDMDDLNEEERVKRGLEDLQPLLKEILAVGMAEKDVGIRIDAARGLEGLNHAEETLRTFESGEWNASETNAPDVDSERQATRATATSKTRWLSCAHRRATNCEVTFDDVLAAADPSTGGVDASEREAFAAAVGAVVIGEESLPGAAERRDIEAASLASTGVLNGVGDSSGIQRRTNCSFGLQSAFLGERNRVV